MRMHVVVIKDVTVYQHQLQVIALIHVDCG
jgi:hypothetical protein